MNIVEIEKVVAKLQGKLFKKANSSSIGAFKSHFKGSGLQFREHQIYHPGDDVRFIDWKLSAKSVGKTYIKTFEEDRNIEIFVVLDVSSTLFMGHSGKSKLEMALEVISLLFLLAGKTKDRVKVVIFHEEIVELPFQTGREGIILLISKLEKIGVLNENGKLNASFNLKKEVSLKRKIALLKSYVARKKEIIYLSDFYNEDELDQMSKLTYSPTFNCFYLTSPFDEANEQKFSLPVNQKDKKSYVFWLKTQKTQEVIYDKKIKKINVAENYLEDFLGLMR